MFFLTCLILIACNQDKNPLPQTLSPQQVVQLPQEMLEISGMISNNINTIYVHNDSGNPPTIYEISLSEQKVLRTIQISNAENLDWEEIATDEDFIYVGDFGNNLGTRDNLVIYKVDKNKVATQDSVEAEIISFHYPEQTDFSPSNHHNFDCEAMLTFDDELFLFTKNRKDQQTQWYSLPKEVGEYPAELQGSFDTDGLITAATFAESNDVIALLGYVDSTSVYQPFLWLFYDFEDNIFDGKNTRLEIELEEQLEAISFQADYNLIFAGEDETGTSPKWIYQIDVEDYLKR